MTKIFILSNAANTKQLNLIINRPSWQDFLASWAYFHKNYYFLWVPCLQLGFHNRAQLFIKRRIVRIRGCAICPCAIAVFAEFRDFGKLCGTKPGNFCIRDDSPLCGSLEIGINRLSPAPGFDSLDPSTPTRRQSASPPAREDRTY